MDDCRRSNGRGLRSEMGGGEKFVQEDRQSGGQDDSGLIHQGIRDGRCGGLGTSGRSGRSIVFIVVRSHLKKYCTYIIFRTKFVLTQLSCIDFSLP
jgi:hypothetical protein